MTDLEYQRILEAEFDRLGRMLLEREELDLKIAKSRQFVFATLNMIPENERKKFEEQLSALVAEEAAASAGLTDSIKNVLLANYPKPLTAATVRDKLAESGFNFSQYSTNPLASVSTVLRRLKPKEVRMASVEGVATYSLTSDYALQMRKRRRARRSPPPSGSIASGYIPGWGELPKFKKD